MSFLQPVRRLGLEEENLVRGPANCYTDPPSIAGVLLDSHLCTAPRKIGACFLTAPRKGRRVWERCLPCPALVSLPAVTWREGGDFI